MNRIRSGERKHQTINRWVKTYSADLYKFARVRLSNSLDAEDAVQKTFVRAFKSFDKLREEANERAWLYAILTNVVKDEIATSKKLPQVVSDDEERSNLENISDGKESPDERISRQEEISQMDDALANLPEIFASPLIMREVSDMKYEDIAKALMIPIGTVMSRLYRARKALAELLVETQAQDALGQSEICKKQEASNDNS